MYDGTSTASQVYETSLKPLVKECLNGFNTSFLVLGHRNCGKTTLIDGGEVCLLSLVAEGLFSTKDVNAENRVIKFQAMEVFGEMIRDLVNPYQQEPSLLQDTKRGVYLTGLSKKSIEGPRDILSWLPNIRSAKVGENSDAGRKATLIYRFEVEFVKVCFLM